MTTRHGRPQVTREARALRSSSQRVRYGRARSARVTRSLSPQTIPDSEGKPGYPGSGKNFNACTTRTRGCRWTRTRGKCTSSSRSCRTWRRSCRNRKRSRRWKSRSRPCWGSCRGVGYRRGRARESKKERGVLARDFSLPAKKIDRWREKAKTSLGVSEVSEVGTLRVGPRL